MAATHVTYEVEEWGTGELWFDGPRLLLHELPRPTTATGGEDHPLADRIKRHFAGEQDDFLDVELDLEDATPFQQAVTNTLRRLPYGETITYGELAAAAGHPNAQRAAGTYCAHNRYPIIVPCHRVVATDGLGSYGSLGITYKRRLLAMEGVVL